MMHRALQTSLNYHNCISFSFPLRFSLSKIRDKRWIGVYLIKKDPSILSLFPSGFSYLLFSSWLTNRLDDGQKRRRDDGGQKKERGPRYNRQMSPFLQFLKRERERKRGEKAGEQLTIRWTKIMDASVYVHSAIISVEMRFFTRFSCCSTGFLLSP